MLNQERPFSAYFSFPLSIFSLLDFGILQYDGTRTGPVRMYRTILILPHFLHANTDSTPQSILRTIDYSRQALLMEPIHDLSTPHHP